ncbi:hypothetical protein K456DRAFT_1932146 [Colletotrichum gloeosporioides 23]|nr:hypothetical protein K456DRAFT_1932146 [Colletotrichum gloeosporioides 23]
MTVEVQDNSPAAQQNEVDARNAGVQRENKKKDAISAVLAGPGKPTFQQQREREIMQSEERLIDTVSGKTFLRYVQFGNAWMTVPLFSHPCFRNKCRLAWVAQLAAAEVLPSDIRERIHGSAFFALFCFWCSNHLHTATLSDVLMAPIAFLMSYILSIFVAIAASVLLLYVWNGMYQRPSARELRRLNSLYGSRISAFSNMIRFSAGIENSMNSVKRMLYYAYNIEQESAHDVKRVDKRLKSQRQPSKGRILFQSFRFSY